MIAEASQSILDDEAMGVIRAGKRPTDDVYPTPDWVVDAILRAGLYQACWHPTMLDAGAGSGVWGQKALEYFEGDLFGVELRDQPRPSGFTSWQPRTDFITWESGVSFDLIVGNPPYSLAEPFIRKSRELLAPGGQIVFLLRLAFLEGQARAKGLWAEFPPERVLVLPKRPSFSGNGKTDAIAYAAFYWRDGFRGQPALGWVP